MEEQTKRDLKAVGKIALGGARIASGVATVFGHGFVAAVTGNHKALSPGLMKVAYHSVEGGTEQVKDGWRELHS